MTRRRRDPRLGRRSAGKRPLVVLPIVALLPVFFSSNVIAAVAQYVATVSVSVTGRGTVRATSGGINCPPACSATYEQGSQVDLDALPAAGAELIGWGGACTGAGAASRCRIGVPSGGTSASAAFGARLTVTKSGNGNVTSTTPGIACGTTCSALLPSGTALVLNAVPEPDYLFLGWGGACSGTGTSCSVTLDAATTVEARFGLGKVDGLGASFQGTWRQSRYRGSLAVLGLASRDAHLVAKVRSTALTGRGVRPIERTFEFDVPAGAFTRSFALPAIGFYPGQYALDLTGTSGGAPIVARAAALRMEPPKEGVVSDAWITVGTRRVRRAPRGTKQLVAHFVYAAKPYIGSKVTISWLLGSRQLITLRKIRWKPVVTSVVTGRSGLPSGRYTCVLRARGLIVYRVGVTIR